jgi:hypothetical protein
MWKETALLRRLSLFLFALLAAAFPLSSQAPSPPGDPLPFLGMKLDELMGRFGPPGAVYAVRGNEEWQDDVVFVYSEGDFYIAKDRVWQVALKSAYGISLGDPKQAALLIMSAISGDESRERGDHALAPLSGGVWQRMLRVNFNGAGLVSAIFVYRADF